MHIGPKCALPALVLLLASCSDFPRDPEGTLDQVRERGTIRVGLTSTAHVGHAKTDRLIARLGRVTQARPDLRTGEAEPLLTQLEQGELDLVLGTFDKKTPWDMRVTIGPALDQIASGKTRLKLAPAMRNGENAWISLVERETRDLVSEQ